MSLDTMDHSKNAHFWSAVRSGVIEGVGTAGLLVVAAWVFGSTFFQLEGTDLEMNPHTLTVASLVGGLMIALCAYGRHHRLRSWGNYRGLVHWQPDRGM